MSVPSQYADLVDKAARAYGVPPGVLAALLEHESGWNTNAIGDGGLARGLGQLHPSSAAQVNMDWNQMANPAVGIPAAAAYLALMFKQFGDWAWALGAYNQGATVIGRAKVYADAILALRP